MEPPVDAVDELIREARALLVQNPTISAAEAEPSLTGHPPPVVQAALDKLSGQILSGGDNIARLHNLLEGVLAEMRG